MAVRFIEPRMLVVPGGEFEMGDPHGASNCRPLHTVQLDQFSLAATAVTNMEYRCFLDDTHRDAPPFWRDPKFSGADQPVVGTNWHDAVTYCQWLSKLSGQAYRLPSEAERERAARGGLIGCRYPWGDVLPPDHDGGRERGLAAVAQDQENAYGLHNMADLVHEWCADWSDRTYYQHSPRKNPKGPAQGTRRIARGGAWRHAVRFSRCGHRSSLPPAKHFNDFGFRVAR